LQRIISCSGHRAFGVAEFASLPGDPSAGMTAAIAFDVAVATAISWTVLSADFNQSTKKTQLRGIVGTVIGYTASTFPAMKETRAP